MVGGFQITITISLTLLCEGEIKKFFKILMSDDKQLPFELLPDKAIKEEIFIIVLWMDTLAELKRMEFMASQIAWTVWTAAATKTSLNWELQWRWTHASNEATDDKEKEQFSCAPSHLQRATTKSQVRNKCFELSAFRKQSTQIETNVQPRNWIFSSVKSYRLRLQP